ncbi:protein required for maturation of hydrogenases [Georgfuchsia toluolica]|uniref:Hydrogenase maturation factor n=1 Tax=Georgfuchsia toluolica TaxID=424218 RepID=A0A916N056_9PROT|nr:hydrogenase formation protein HypD [Georgfuchsia toluolica]CAG4883568.1 protein required for maturation of hydrogenases [Georgfuchsia toluolica]
MKYIDEFRDGDLARGLAAAIAREAQSARDYRLMEFCGGHTHAISRYGIADLLPSNVRMIHGPGCPVCVLPIGRIDQAIRLAREYGVILCTYADTLRVPASHKLSLLKARAQGADVRMVYSTADALRIARENPAREVVFLAIGFETTTPPTAVALKQARMAGLTNFSVLCNHVLTPAAMHAILAAPDVALDGFIGPAHVSTVIGSAPYEPFPRDYGKPVVIAGFEPLDVMRAIQMLLQQINAGRAVVENEFTRAVTREGNRKACALMSEVFELRDSYEWRGLGTVPHSALKPRAEYAAFDAELRFDIPYAAVPDHKACECGAILRGEKRPQECRIFGTACTPETPLGSCMVSSEGACAAHYTYGRFRKAG